MTGAPANAVPAGFDTVVIGAGVNGLVAAIALARAGERVLVVDRADELGGEHRTVEFALGFRASPLAPDLGWIPAEVRRGTGIAERLAELEVVADPTVVGVDGGGGFLPLHRDPAVTAERLRHYSPRDAIQWPLFAGRLARLAGFLGSLYGGPPPRIDASSPGELWDLARLGSRLKRLGRVEMVELLRTVPMAVGELLDEWFETDVLKAALTAGAVATLCQGPRSGGTAFTLLHGQVGAAPGAIRSGLRLRGGVAALATLLVEEARRRGVELRSQASVAEIEIRDDAVSGVRLETGERIAASHVLSTADPTRTLLGLVDPLYLDPELIGAVQNIRYRGAQARVLLGLDALPVPPGLEGGERALAGRLVLAPSLAHLERAYDATKYGEVADEPLVEVRIPSLLEEGLAPAGKHVMVLDVQFAPYRLRAGDWSGHRERLGDRALELAGRVLPGLADRVLHRAVLTPADLEAEFGLTEGAVSQGEMMLDQILFMRPVAGWSRYALPVQGLFLGGSGAHPGPGITGAPGWLAAQAALRARAS
jgi:phytoene dehydrogenase-like protein